jgi:hypothetical protein
MTMGYMGRISIVERQNVDYFDHNHTKARHEHQKVKKKFNT